MTGICNTPRKQYSIGIQYLSSLNVKSLQGYSEDEIKQPMKSAQNCVRSTHTLKQVFGVVTIVMIFVVQTIRLLLCSTLIKISRGRSLSSSPPRAKMAVWCVGLTALPPHSPHGSSGQRQGTVSCFNDVKKMTTLVKRLCSHVYRTNKG